MADGIDFRSFQAAIDTLAPDARRKAMRDLNDWMRAASRSVGWPVPLGLTCVAFGAGLVAFGSLFEPSIRALHPIGLAFLAVGSGLSLWSNRRAREWRRANPFDAWRSTNEPIG